MGSLAEEMRKYKTVELHECKGCANRWHFEMPDAIKCTTCGLHTYVCEKCRGEVKVIPESQASAILKCKACSVERVVLF